MLSLFYGLAAGAAAVGFMMAVHYGFALIWRNLALLDAKAFVIVSFAVVAGSSLAVGILMATVKGAAGSGIPELKAFYWTDLGTIPLRSVMVKFIGGVVSLAGGASLGREGPTVLVAGGIASNLAALLGIDRRKRRHATATGAAAGLAAAFNTPLAGVSFVLEEVLGDLSSRLVGSVVLGAVAGAFVVYGLVGKQPAFTVPSVDEFSWSIYLVVPFTAALAALCGVAFQRGAMRLRLRMRGARKIPLWLRPLAGGLVVWAFGCAVYLSFGKMGVFGLGYGDLSDALMSGIGWKIAGILVLAKLVSTVASYGTGGCGGIFSPTLFIGAMCGFFTAGVAGHWVPLTPTDHLILAATGMSACFGAVVRSPVTSILMIFEMTHQFGMIPSLLIGCLVSQGIARLAGKENFYDEILVQDGHEIHKIAPPNSLAGWREMPVASVANRRTVSVSDLSADKMRAVMERHPYKSFPVILNGELKGVVTRKEIERAMASGAAPEIEKAVVCRESESLQEVEGRLIQSSAGLFVVVENEGGPVTGVFTLHDLLRAQAAVLD